MSRTAAALVVLLGLPGMGFGDDRPISGKMLLLRHGPKTQKLAFVSHDPAFLFPAIGSLNDPATRDDGLVVELFPRGTSPAAPVMDAPPGMGDPGWQEGTAPVPTYAYRNQAAPGGPSTIARVTIRQGKLLKVVARASGLALDGPQGSVGIRLRTGDLRNCALFAGAAVRKDEAGRFVGRNAPASALADCSDAQLRGLACEDTLFPTCGGRCPEGSACGGSFIAPFCFCVAAAQPCGDTAPVCNGECPAGQVCSNLGGVPTPSCGCLPAGSTPCGDGTVPACGGDCPSGLSCLVNSFPLPGGGSLDGCACLTGPPPPDACGGCPPHFFCLFIPPGPAFCAPHLCSGGQQYPTCGGDCSSEQGTTCQSTPTGGGGGVCACLE